MTFWMEWDSMNHQEDAILTGTQNTMTALPPLLPKDDFVFRKLFGDQNHVDMIISFLKTFVELPDEEYADVTIEDPNLLPDIKEGKACVLDLKLRTRTGKIIHVEVQRDDTGEMCERMAVYGAKMLGEQIRSGEYYKSLNWVISVLITDFPLFKKTADYHSRFKLRSEDGSLVLTDALEFHILELCKIPVTEDGRKVWPWLKFLASGTKEEFAMLEQTYTELQKPVARLMEMSADEILRRQKDSWDKARWDEAARMRMAEAKGKAEGKAERATEIAANMRQEGLPVSVIAKITGLSLAEIEALPVK
jgi:predicted transposase/invertase (TIGR01784 family)